MKKNLWLSILVSIAFLIIGFSGLQAQKTSLTVYFLNVGQGDSIFISTPNGKNILIDGGKRAIPSYSKFDAGEKVILPFLKNKGVKRIDTLIATHPDIDHIGGLLAVLDSDIQIDKVLDCGYKHTSYTYQDFLKKIERRRETEYYQPRAGQVLNWGDEVKVQVLSPAHLFSDSNNCSIVVKLTYGNISFLFTGDVEKEAEGEMVSRYGNRLESTILKASHHGSRTGSSLNFLKAVNPQVAVISCGWKNRYGHPHKEVIDKLARCKVKVYRTDYQGMITVTTDGETYKVMAEREVPPGERPEVRKRLSRKVNINIASQRELETLPRVGPVTARKIIEHRPFRRISDIQNVPRIGPKTYEGLKDLVTVKKMDINSITYQELSAVPGIRPEIARSIIDYRESHGLFKKMREVKKIPGINYRTYRFLKVLFTIEER